jgi:hypothetical protein
LFNFEGPQGELRKQFFFEPSKAAEQAEYGGANA